LIKAISNLHPSGATDAAVLSNAALKDPFLRLPDIPKIDTMSSSNKEISESYSTYFYIIFFLFDGRPGSPPH
jgi:hypothetical protein